MSTILDIAGYGLDYATPTGFTRALDDVSLQIAEVGTAYSDVARLHW